MTKMIEFPCCKLGICKEEEPLEESIKWLRCFYNPDGGWINELKILHNDDRFTIPELKRLYHLVGRVLSIHEPDMTKSMELRERHKDDSW